jgi:hypothetical protein
MRTCCFLAVSAQPLEGERSKEAKEADAKLVEKLDQMEQQNKAAHKASETKDKKEEEPVLIRVRPLDDRLGVGVVRRAVGLILQRTRRSIRVVCAVAGGV